MLFCADIGTFETWFTIIFLQQIPITLIFVWIYIYTLAGMLTFDALFNIASTNI